MIGRCLEPLPHDRYQTAAELAADLQAVADDLPLRGAREPWTSRAAGWLRRRRKKLAMAAGVVLALSAVAGSALNFWNEKNKIHNLALNALYRGLEAADHEDWTTANIYYNDAAAFADRHSLNPWNILTSMKSLLDFGNLLGKRNLLELPMSLEEIKSLAREKSKVAERHEGARVDADHFFEAADNLRFRLLLGEEKELVQVFEDLQKARTVLRSQERRLEGAEHRINFA